MMPGDKWQAPSISRCRRNGDEDMTDCLTADNAKELYKKVKTIDGEYMRQQTLSILNQIKESAMGGNSSILFDKKLDPIIVVRLESLGYKVRINYGDQRDPYTSTVISWA